MVAALNKVFRQLTLQLRHLLILHLVLLSPGLSLARDTTAHFGDRVIVCMIHLEHAEAEHLASALAPFLSPEGTITSHGPTNTLIIKDRAPVVNMLSEVIKGKPCVPAAVQPEVGPGRLTEGDDLNR